MNGAQPFVYIATCGCVMSQAGMKAMEGSAKLTPPSDEKHKGERKETENDGEKTVQFEVCPQCSTKYDKREDVRLLNPDVEMEAVMRATMELRRERAKAGKSSKKRKAAAVSEHGREGTLGDANGNGKTKKTKTAQPAPSLNPTISAASRAVVTSLAMEEAKRKANMSDAVKSLYESKNDGVKETFMTRGTFTRVST